MRHVKVNRGAACDNEEHPPGCGHLLTPIPSSIWEQAARDERGAVDLMIAVVVVVIGLIIGTFLWLPPTNSIDWQPSDDGCYNRVTSWSAGILRDQPNTTVVRYCPEAQR